MTAQLIAIFAFGLVMTGVVYLGIVRAREIAERVAKVQTAATRDENRGQESSFEEQPLREAH